MAELRQLNLPAIAAAAEGIRRSRFQTDQIQAQQAQQERITDLTGGAARGDAGAAGELAGLDPKRAEDAVAFFKKNTLPVVLSEAKSVDGPESYTRFVGKLTKAKLIDPDDPPPPQYDPSFMQRFISEGEAMIPQDGKDFTLSQGQTRFGPDGKPVANVPAADAEPEASPQLIRLQNERDAAIAQGNQQRATEIQDVIDKMGETVGRTEFDAPSANRRDEIRAERDGLSRARGRINSVLTSIAEKPTRAGAPGTISRFVQTTTGVVADLTGFGVDVPEFIQDTTQQIADDINSGRTSEDVAGLIVQDDKLPEMDNFVNGLAYSLARARKGSGRLNNDDVKRALPDVQITGLRSVKDIVARLKAVDEEIAGAEEDLNKRLGGQQPKYRVDPNGNLVRIN